MQLAMMIADATPSVLLERSISSVGVVPLSSSIGSAHPSTLPKERCAECQRPLTQKQTLCMAAAHFSDLSATAQGSNMLSTIAPGTPTPFLFRSSSGMLFSRKDTSGIPQKSVILLCSSTAVAKFSAASPVILLKATLHHQGTHKWYEKHRE